MSIAIAIALALIIGWACLRFLPAGAEGRMPLPYLIAFIHFLWIPSALCGVLAAAQGYWHLAVLAVVLAVIIAAFDLPYYRHTSAYAAPQRSAGGQCATRPAAEFVTHRRSTLHSAQSIRVPWSHPELLVTTVGRMPG